MSELLSSKAAANECRDVCDLDTAGSVRQILLMGDYHALEVVTQGHAALRAAAKRGQG